MNAIVVSGGGSKGAWAGGVAEFLYEERGKKWDIFLGTSTGSLIATKLPSYNFDELKRMYTNVTNDSIFSVNPFNSKNKIKIPNVIWRLLRKKLSIGEFGNLEKLLKNEFTFETFSELKKTGIDIVITTSNMTKGIPEFFTLSNSSYSKFIEAVLASVSVPLATSPVKINDMLYLDGGVLEHAPIQKAIELGATEIDIIILRPEQYNDNWKPENMFDVLLRTIDLLQREVSFSDVAIATLLSKIEKDVTLNFYYTPRELSRNSLIFNKEQMLNWWNEGRKEFRYTDFKTIKLKKKNN